MRLKLDQTAFAEAGGVKKGSQIAYEKDDTPPTTEYLRKLEPHGVDIGYVLTGRRTDGSDSGTGDIVEVEEIDLAYGLGGTFADGLVEITRHRFPLAFIQSITSTPPAMLTIARGRGDSMMPTLMDGDMVLIDRSQRTVREQDAIWAFTVGDIAMIKRVRVRGEKVLILSDNDRVPSDEAHHEEVRVVGRVIFIGRKV
ncbi:S24 family peptidase [Sphingomonas sp. TX0522]|uniref:S24 family peptidase n=1 Tax=Sphingomonas sp. TX0522 TaxID=2479205 RepID=UPI001E5CE09E|nr:S24 family peptidase [Sphingomonas sp. TX0522]